MLDDAAEASHHVPKNGTHDLACAGILNPHTRAKVPTSEALPIVKTRRRIDGLFCLLLFMLIDEASGRLFICSHLLIMVVSLVPQQRPDPRRY